MQLIALGFLIFTTGHIVRCQVASAMPDRDQVIVTKGSSEFGFWGGVSFQSPTLIGQTSDARFAELGLRYGRVLLTSKTVAFSWTIDVLPLAILSTKRLAVVPSGSGFVIAEKQKSVFGWGVSPIGLKFNFRRQQRVQPFVAATGGFLYFKEDVPVAGAARFNFTFDFGGGLQIINSNRRSLSIGYKYQHISNGDRSSINPGVDVQMVYVGFSIFR